MKRIYLFVVIFALITSPVFADTIILKNGKRITVGQTWEEDKQIKCERFGSVIGYPKSMVERVIADQPSFSGTTSKIKVPEMATIYSDLIKDIHFLQKNGRI